jgi:sensor domain DACNV-containing protein
MFNYPKDIKKLLKQAWGRKGYVLPKVTDLLPDDDILEELVEVAYNTSFKSEEQRKIAFRVVFCTKDDVRKEPDNIYEIRHVEFPKPIEYNVHELLRLAPATDHRKVLIGVMKSDSLSSQLSSTKLKIWGLIDTGLGLWKFYRREGNKGFASLRHLTISSDAPGSLTISLSGEVLVILRHGELYTPPLFSLRDGPLSEFFQKAQNEIYKDVLATIEHKENEPLSLLNDPREEYIKYLERLIFCIRDKLHGGTILILSKDLSVDDLIKENNISIKYRCEYDIVWDLIVKKSNLEHKYYTIFESMLGTKSDLPNEKYWEHTSIEMDMRKTESYLHDSVLFLSSLASVDGALIITDSLNLFGFGGELRVYGESMHNIKFSEDAFCRNFSEKPPESFGTRHRSAFRFCNEYPKSVAFVISQDGDVKAVKKVNNDLIVWPDPNAGLVGGI